MISWWVITVTSVMGVRYAMAKKFDKHRFCMIWCTAALMVNPLHRLIWYAGVKIKSAEAFGDFMGYLGFIGNAMVAAATINYTLAAVYTLAVVPPKATNKKKVS